MRVCLHLSGIFNNRRPRRAVNVHLDANRNDQVAYISGCFGQAPTPSICRRTASISLDETGEDEDDLLGAGAALLKASATCAVNVASLSLAVAVFGEDVGADLAGLSSPGLRCCRSCTAFDTAAKSLASRDLCSVLEASDFAGSGGFAAGVAFVGASIDFGASGFRSGAAASFASDFADSVFGSTGGLGLACGRGSTFNSASGSARATVFRSGFGGSTFPSAFSGFGSGLG